MVPDLAFTDLTGEAVKLSDLRGQYALLDFWATWCGPCIAELPAFWRLHDTYRADKRLVVLGLNLGDDPDKARRFVDEHQMPWTNGSLGGLVDNPVLARYAVSSVPAYFLIGPDGKLIRSGQSARRWSKPCAARCREIRQDRPPRSPATRHCARISGTGVGFVQSPPRAARCSAPLLGSAADGWVAPAPGERAPESPLPAR